MPLESLSPYNTAMGKQQAQVIAVSLNPAIDRGIEVPNFAIGAHQVGRQIFRRAAGKAVNLARVLNLLKVPTAVTGFIGRGQQDYFEKTLSRENLACELFAIEGQTRENITIVDPVSKIETHIRDRGFHVDAASLGKLRKKLGLIARKDVVVCFSGSLPEGIGIEEFIELLQICQMQGARVCVDSGGSVLRGCSPLKLFLVKPNLLELSEMLGAEIRTCEQVLRAADILKEMVQYSLVTCGAEGGYIFGNGVNIRGHVPMDPAEVKNTVGCGDAMLGGFLAGLLTGRDVKDSYRYGLAVASAAATSLIPAEVHAEDIQRFYDQAQIEQVKHTPAKRV